MKRVLIGIATVTSLLATGALAADLPAKVYTKAPVYVDPGYNWSGFYIGGNAGYSWGRAGTDGTQSGTTSVSEFAAITNVLIPGRPVITGSAEPGCSVWKLTFRAATSAAVLTSVSSPDVPPAPACSRRTTSSTGLAPRAAASVSFRPTASCSTRRAVWPMAGSPLPRQQSR
jgi:hypothetical protein